ncbi:unnamed protein product [Owenia fusiformis]|uniref:Uncharacterized protein n=1 Tax=Owenia fusiformis TaxID=6347 RepID=A0A8J1U1J0_OWEFU|nr:unnamed protein product [Owenia fusiformis]
MMERLDDISAIKLAERLGGPDGYNLLTGTSKKYIPFAFINQGISYAPFLVLLLESYYTCGVFYQNLKRHLFSTPHKESAVNFATDTKREQDHIDVMKGFRSGSTLESVTRRMAAIDILKPYEKIDTCTDDDLGWKTSNIDLKYITSTSELIFRQGGFSSNEQVLPLNVYSQDDKMIHISILHEQNKDVGEYMVMKYAAKKGLFGFTNDDIPDAGTLKGPKDILRKAQQSSGITIKTSHIGVQKQKAASKNLEEEKRKKKVARESKRYNALTSKMNQCQAIVRPDMTKRVVGKARGMMMGLKNLLRKCQILPESLIQQDVEKIPENIANATRIVVLEFAGIKFKTSNAISGSSYLSMTERSINRILFQMCPKTHTLILCEEKYGFTPDILKDSTRQQRKKGMPTYSAAHLRTESQVISMDKFSPQAIQTTTEGKRLISIFLADNLSKLKIKGGVKVTVDSELITKGCTCDDSTGESCECAIYTQPIQRSSSDKVQTLPILQRKGEAEMAQMDWVISSYAELKEGHAVLSFLNSGDIDGLIIHLYTLTYQWPRDEKGKFKNPVYLVLQKTKSMDVISVTNMIESLEETYIERGIYVRKLQYFFVWEAMTLYQTFTVKPTQLYCQKSWRHQGL